MSSGWSLPAGTPELHGCPLGALQPDVHRVAPRGCRLGARLQQHQPGMLAAVPYMINCRSWRNWWRVFSTLLCRRCAASWSAPLEGELLSRDQHALGERAARAPLAIVAVTGIDH